MGSEQFFFAGKKESRYEETISDRSIASREAAGSRWLGR
jgi:hypothetical protein